MSEKVSPHIEQVSAPLPEKGSIFDVATHVPALPEHLSKIRVESGRIKRDGPVRVGEDPRLLKHLEMLRRLDAQNSADGLEDVRAELDALQPVKEPTPVAVANPIPAA